MPDRVFVDTNPIIYYLNEHEPFASKFLFMMQKFVESNSEFYTSTITDAEVLIKPYKEGNNSLVDKYKDFLDAVNFLKCFITDSIAERSAKLRAKYAFLKLADSLQIAAALECNCNVFITNDKQLKSVSEISVAIIGDVEL